MKIWFLKFTVIPIILLCEFFTVTANETFQYELTEEKIKSAWLSETQKGSYAVIVELKELHKEDFSRLTGNNVGKRLTITFSGKILTSAVINCRIDSGIIKAGDWGSEEDARKFMETLLPKHREDTKRAP